MWPVQGPGLGRFVEDDVHGADAAAQRHGGVPRRPDPQNAILRSVLAGMAKPVYLLDFTYLSQLRKDAHPTMYNGGTFGQDCTHWCIAGLPDTWNVLLYGALTGQ
jgi:hypothetical protein